MKMKRGTVQIHHPRYVPQTVCGSAGGLLCRWGTINGMGHICLWGRTESSLKSCLACWRRSGRHCAADAVLRAGRQRWSRTAPNITEWISGLKRTRQLYGLTPTQQLPGSIYYMEEDLFGQVVFSIVKQLARAGFAGGYARTWSVNPLGRGA